VRVTFAVPGTFVIRVLAHDGGADSFQDVTVTVTSATAKPSAAAVR
jgi:hypothetical protein